MIFSSAASLMAIILFAWRMRRRSFHAPTFVPEVTPSVSIIVPCRNEENNIGALLASLQRLQGIRPEILVVDDDSSDRTVEVAQRAGVRVLRAPPKPEGWVGKSWACQYGADSAQGELLLFTDADTIHRPASLRQAVSFLQAENADLISAPPFHLCRLRWERALGLFFLLPLIATAADGVPRIKRLYAIGQYLLIRRGTYESLGGHKALRASLTEDIDLARNVLHHGGTYKVFPSATFYDVQMYPNAASFARGWIRLLRLGSRKLSLFAFAEVVLLFHLFFQFDAFTVVGVALVAWAQRRHGAFSWWGALFAPLSLVVFAALSLVGWGQSALGKGIEWHGRIYADS